MSYFSKFPLVRYKGVTCTNITVRPAVADGGLAGAANFYPYDINEGQRPDSLAFDYYDRSNFDWLVYHSNKIVDPFYDWYMTNDQLNRFVKKKYGNLVDAKERIAFYRINWKSDETKLSLSGYNSLTSYRKPYWMPILGDDNEIIAYKRKPLESIVNSNRTIVLEVSQTSAFEVGERVKQINGSVLVASAQIANINPTLKRITVEKVEDGDFSASGALIGATSDATATIVSTLLINTSIAYSGDAAVSVYWEPVSYFDYEFELNESKRSINLIDKRFSEYVEKEVGRVLNE